MRKVLRFRYRSVFKQDIRKEKEKEGAAGLTAGLGRLPGRPVRAAPRPHHQTGPVPWPVLSGGPPASLSAWAGSQAGQGRLPGRPDGRFPLFFSPNSSILDSYLRGFFPK